MDSESIVSFLATISIFLAACRRYGHNILDQLSTFKAPSASGSRFSTNALLISFDQTSLDYVKGFIKSLLPGPSHFLEGIFDIADVLRASVYLQLQALGIILSYYRLLILLSCHPRNGLEFCMWHIFILIPSKMKI